MTNTTTQTAREIVIEDMQVGHRYVDVIAGFESRWGVSSVERRPAMIQVLRSGEWHTPELVTVTYRNGQSITQEVGTVLAIDCDVAA